MILKKFLLLILLCVSFSFAQDISGTGEFGDPYLLYDKADVDSIHDLGTNNYYKLANDIDMENLVWEGLYVAGTDTFQLDGGGYTLSNIVQGGMSNISYNIGFIDSISFSGAGTVDTIFKDIIFDGYIAEWDSSLDPPSYPNVSMAALVGYLNCINTTDGVYFENVVIRNVSVWVNDASYSNDHAYVGGFVGQGYQDNTILYFNGCGIESSFFYGIGTGTFGRSSHVGGFVGSRGPNPMDIRFTGCFVTDSYFYSDINPSTLEYSSGTGVSAFVTNNSYLYFNYCYAHGNTLRSQGVGGGSSDAVFGGILTAFANEPRELFQCYFANNTYIRDNPSPELNSDHLGFFMGERVDTSYAIGNSFIDTVGLYESGWYGIYGENSEFPKYDDTLTVSNTTDMRDESTYTGWDFDNVWSIDPSTNDGFPYPTFTEWYLGGDSGRKPRIIIIRNP